MLRRIRVHELADADRAGVAVAADANRQHGSCWPASRRVATDGMRPCTELKPCDEFRKYAGLLLEQPMPESFIDALGIDAHLEERVDDALGDRVVPAAGAQASSCCRDSCDTSRLMRLVFLAGAGVRSLI